MKALTVCVIAAAAFLAMGIARQLFAPGIGPGWLLDAGLIVLMATPVLRVVFAITEFARSRDWVFVATALAVLVFLGLSVIYSIRQP